MKILYLIILGPVILFTSLTVAAQRAPFGEFKEIRLGVATCRATGTTLIINSGEIERIYRLTPWGLCTTGLRLPGGKEQLWHDADRQADWDMGFDCRGKLEDLTARVDDDSGFTSKHITVICEFEYAAAGIALRYIIWVYSGSGIRTQLALKALKSGQQPDLSFTNRQVEYIPGQLRGAVITAFGYYNDTQHRDKDTTPILQEEQVLPNTSVNWANGLVIRHKTNGLILVKESHKCVNQPGIATGGYDMGQDGVAITGPGLARKDVDTGTYKTCWASWIIPYRGDSTNALLALKGFDRLRYPVGKRDMYIMANTWGSSDASIKGGGRYAGRQENVLKEIASQAGLGIEVQEIDDGWQGLTYKHWRPAATADVSAAKNETQRISYYIYPDGWSPVKSYAASKGIKLGLWAAWTIPEQDLIWNYNHGGFNYFKIDFSDLNTKEKLDGLIGKIRSFVLYTHHQVRINWDATENAPRIGYFYAREFGNISLENRKPYIPENAIYKPYLVLRDFWQLSKYINLNQFQIPIQDIDRVDRQQSDAYLYSNAYAVAISLMGSPLFFGLTQYYTAKDRERIKNILRVYKLQRSELFKGYVFPVGNTPDDSSWTGFQDRVSHSAGYLLIFRELHNENSSQQIRLWFIRNHYIVLTDLLTGEKKKRLVGKNGWAKFTIEKPADFRFCEYQVLPGPMN